MQKLLNTHVLPCPENFVDQLLERLDLKNDAQLSRLLRLQPPAVSKLRNGVAPLTAEIMLRIHEAGEISMPDIRVMARVQPPAYPEWVEVIAKPNQRLKMRQKMGLSV